MVHRRDGQRLERRQETASTGAGATGLVAAAHRRGDRRPSRDGQRLSARPPGWRSAVGVGKRRRGRKNRPPRRGCAPTPSRQNRPSPGRCPPTLGRPPAPGRAPRASACEPYRKLIAEALGRGRNAMVHSRISVRRCGCGRWSKSSSCNRDATPAATGTLVAAGTTATRGFLRKTERNDRISLQFLGRSFHKTHPRSMLTKSRRRKK
jgi:hypothetical protein